MKINFALPLSVLVVSLGLAPVNVFGQAVTATRGARGIRAETPAFNDSPTTQRHLDAAQADLNRALAALQRATTTDPAIRNYGGHLPDATNDVQMAIANVAGATKYIAAHPAENPLPASSSVAETLPAQPAVLQAANRVPGLNMLAAIDALNSALADLTNNSPGNGITGVVLGDIGGYRTKIVADIHQASTDVLACIAYSNQVQGPGLRSGPAYSRGVSNRGQRGAEPVSPVLQNTTLSHLDATQYFLEQALNALDGAVANRFGGHTEQAITAVTHTQADLAEATTYVKTHPESNVVTNNNPALAETSSVRPVAVPTEAFTQMQRSLESLNAALGPLLNNASVFALGDIGGYRTKLLDDIAQVIKQVQAGLDYANGARGAQKGS